MPKCVIKASLIGIALLAFTGRIFATEPPEPQKTVVIMGGSSLGLRNATKQDAEIAFNTVLDEVVRNPDMKINVSVYPTTEDLYAAFDKGEIDGIFGTPLEYMGRANQLGEDVMALSYKGNGVQQSFVLVVRKDDGIDQIKALENKRLTLSKFQDVEAMYLNTLLLKSRLPEIPEFFSERLDAKNPNIAIMDVFFRKSDATIVRESEYLTAIELNPQLGKKLAILNKSAPYIPALGAVRKSLDREKIRSLMQDIEKVSATSKGEKILALTQANSIVIISHEEVQSVIDLMREYASFSKGGSQKIGPSVVKSREKRHARK